MRNSNGSTIVAVLAALVFIGIVIASMLRNTGSQSTVSHGYGSALDMNSAASGGIVATEAFIQSSDVARRTKALAIIQGILDVKGGKVTAPTEKETKEKPYVFGDKYKMHIISDGRFFRSRIIDFNENTMQTTFEVESGRSEYGKCMKRVRAFYSMDAKIEGKSKWSGLNTMLLNADMEYASGDITVKGHATFMDRYALGSSGTNFSFLPDDNTGEGSAFFYKAARIGKAVDFSVPAFFNDDAIINSATVFNDHVGFNKMISTDNYSGGLKVGKDLWIKEGFKTTNIFNGTSNPPYNGVSSHIIKFIGIGPQKSNLFYTDKLPIKNPDNSTAGSPCANEGYDVSWQCFDMNNNTLQNIKYDAGNKSNFSTANILDGLGMVNEADAAKNNPTNPGTAAAHYRVDYEPDLSPTNITAIGKQFLTINQLEPGAGPDGSISGLSITQVNNWYTKFPESAYPQYYSEGHLLVQVTGKIDFANPTTSTFNNKIAFVLENGGNISGKYFNSDIGANSNASTLIYVGETGRLNNFGCEKDFRGLIYVDEKNNTPNQQNTFMWGPDSKIDGAVLLKGKGRINWMGGHATISKNDEVLSGYVDFITPKPGQPSGQSGKTITLSPGKDRIGLRLLGYYHDLK